MHRPSNELGFDPVRLDRIKPWMQAHVDENRLAGLAVQITRRGQVAFFAHTGVQDIETQMPVSDSTLWRIYSMTKPVTSLVALMLYEEGAFQLDQAVSDFLPEYRNMQVWKGEGHALEDTEPAQRQITIHDLMTHQSGIIYGNPSGNALEREISARGLDLNDRFANMAEASVALAQLPLAFEPGARWFYGLSTDVLGRLIEVICDKPLGDVFAERVFAPLGMEDTAFEVPKEKQHRLATLYQYAEGGFERYAFQDEFNAPVSLQSGGGGLVSSLPDYQRFANMLLRRGQYDGGHLLGRKTFDLMVSNAFEGDLVSRGQRFFSETTFEGIGFGLGFSVMLDPTKAKIIGSKGEFAWGGVASTAFWVDPVEEMTVILMTQLLPSSAHTFRRQLRVLSYQALV